MGSLIKGFSKPPLKQWVIYQSGGCMYGNCCKQKIQNNKKIKFSQTLLEVKESTSVEGPTNCNAATSTTRQCNNNDKYNNNIKETLARSG